MEITSLHHQTPNELIPLVDRLSQEIRQSLHHVSGFLNLVTEEPLSHSQANFLAQCQRSIDQLNRSVTDLAELTATECYEPVSGPVHPAELLPAFQEWISVLCDNKNVEFHPEAQELPECVETSVELLETVLYRVLERRIRASRGGSISLEITWKDETLTIDILDTGSVIEPEVIADAEAPLEKANQIGLWLRLARMRLARAGGSLTLVSNTSRGVTLRISVPARKLEPQESEALATPSVVRHRSAEVGQMSLLIAEDSDESFTVFNAFVQPEGHQVTRAVNGEEAVELYKAGQFDLVFLDVQMPVMDGYTAARLIREWETKHGLTRIPVVLLSSENAQKLTRIGASIGCSGYLTKPIPKAELIRALRHYGGYEVRTPAPDPANVA